MKERTDDYKSKELTKTQEEVLTLVLSWMKKNGFNAADQEQAEEIWRRFIGNYNKSLHTKNIRIWAAAVVYLLGRIHGYKWLNQAFLAKAFSVSPGSISLRWQELRKHLNLWETNAKYNRELVEDFFSPTAAEVFRKLMTYTQSAERWKSYVGEIFFKFVGTEAPPLPIDLILELLIFITCDRSLPDGSRIIDYFLAENKDLSNEEKQFLFLLRNSKFGLFEVKGSENNSWLKVEDLYRDKEIRVASTEISGIEQGDIIMSRIIPVEGESFWRFGGNLVILNPSATKELAELARKWFWEFSVSNRGWATRESFIQENSFRFWRWLIGQ